MKVWAAIYNMVAIVLLVMLLIVYLNISKVMQRDFDQARLNYAIDFATEAMFQKTLETENLDMDYVESGIIQLNASDALDIFSSLMCLNYGLSTSEENMGAVENAIACAVLAGADGYYITEMVVDEMVKGNNIVGDGYRLRWSTKIPYIVYGNNKQYAIDFVKRKYVSIQNINNVVDINNSIVVPIGEGYPLNVNDAMVTKEVNKQITDSMVVEIDKRNYNKREGEYKFFLPVETTVKGVNPVNGQSILVLLQGIDFASSERMSAVSVSGYKVVKKVSVIGLREKATGSLYYCYETQIPADREREYEIVDYFDNIKVAGLDKRGFAPHLEFIANKITK